MTKKAARKILRKYQHKIRTTDARWLKKLWAKCTAVVLKED